MPSALRRSEMVHPRAGQTVWLTLPPMLTNNFHPEVGLAELTSNLVAAGHRVVQRDLNVELIYDECTRGAVLARVARWLIDPGEKCVAERHSPRFWYTRFERRADQLALGPTARTVELEVLLENERRRTNRSHRPVDEWRRERPARVVFDAASDWTEAQREGASAFVSLCNERPGFWEVFVETLQYVWFAPASFGLPDVLAAADREVPILERFYARVLDELALGGNPDVFGVSLHAHDQLVPALRLLRHVKMRWPDVVCVAGGPWCSAARDLLPVLARLFDQLDAVVVGKGLDPVLAILERLAKHDAIVAIPGVAVRNQGRVVSEPPGPSRPLSKLEMPSFEGLPLAIYPHKRIPVRLHDGCPWGRCRFCYHVLPGIHMVGAEPVSDAYLDRAVEHVRRLREGVGIRWFTLLDHAVPFNTLERFARRVRERKLDVEWDTMARFEPGMTEEQAHVLAGGGGREIFLGVETIDPEGLKALRKGITVPMIEHGLEVLRAAGLTVRVFLLNYPGQSRESLEKTLRWSVARVPMLADAMLGRFTLARGTVSWQSREQIGLELPVESEPCLDVFQLPFVAANELPFDEYKALWSRARKQLISARTAADENAVKGPGPAVTTPSMPECCDVADATAYSDDDRSTHLVADSPRPKRTTPKRSHMRVTLLGTGLAALHAQGESRRYNLATAYLQAYLQAHPSLSSSVDITRIDIPFNLDRPTFEDDVLRRVLATRPDVLGLSCYAWDLQAQMKLAAQVREKCPSVRIVIGGPSASYGSAALLGRYPAVDVAVRGEGEETLARLLASDFQSLRGVPGTAWRDQHGLVHEEPLGPPVEDLSVLRSPMLDGVLEPPRENLLLEFSRGCIYRCKHCAWQTHGSGVRLVPAERVRDEIAWARERGYKHAFIIDSAINNDDSWLDAMSRAYSEGDPDGSVVASYFINYRFVTKAQLGFLKRIPTHEVLVGLESVNAEALRTTGRKPKVKEEFAAAVDLLAEHVGPVTPNVMFGMPGDTLDGFRQTLDYIAALAERPGPKRIRHARVHWTIVPPGSHFAENADQYGIVVHDDGVPYAMGTSTFPREDLLAGLQLITDHPRADLFVWEDAEPIRILGGSVPDMNAPGGGRVGGPAPERIADDDVLRVIAPLTVGRALKRGWTVAPLERAHGFPVVVLQHPDGRTVRMGFRPRDSQPRPLGRSRMFDLTGDRASAGTEEHALLCALVDLVAKNDGDPNVRS